MKDTKVVQLADRMPRIQKQSGKKPGKKKENRRLVLYLSVLFLLVLVVVYFRSPFSNVSGVHIKGSHYMSKEAAMKIAGITYETSYFLINPADAEQKLQQQPTVAKAKVSKRFWHQVDIVIEEYKTAGYVEREGKLVPVLGNGRMLGALPDRKLPVSAPLLANMEEEAVLKDLAGELDRMPAGIFRSISEIHLEPKPSDPLRIRLYMNEGYQVMATVRDLANKMEPYPLILQNIKPGEHVLIHLEMGAYIERIGAEGKKNEG
ncbi:cell division protein FtsQ/DivIB [Ectobacillus ponti]|uniref:Cell division protein DivIB n=1 Tax=Ectobacillus ponti TaxID=2961894 RepID=A0AA42BU71_9BACI|nr:FtsQ-type POTRA domain-containing protein [Ectobacillus ponti]MCP8970243.1 FtsQ-type POTRA domain-containing protein [Ectobacillus ponti]